MNPQDSTPVEVVESTEALGALQRAEIDMQIATAKKYPRSPAEVKKKMLSFATLDQETAEGCFYVMPARRGSDKPIMGPSVRLAEIAVASYGHIRAGTRVIGVDGKFIVAQGFCHDLENNVSIAMEVRRRITKSNGELYGEDMQGVAGAAACAIAFRNAVFKVVPMALVKPVYDKCLSIAAGDEKSLAARRVEAIKAFEAMGVKRDQIFASVGAKGVEDIDLGRLTILIGFHNAIRDKEATVEEIFSPKADDTAAPATGAGLKSVDSAPPPPAPEKPAAAAPAPAETPVTPPPAAAEQKADDPVAVKKMINAIEGLALDLDLTSAKLLEMANVGEAAPKAKLQEVPLTKLTALLAELRATWNDRKAKQS